MGLGFNNAGTVGIRRGGRAYPEPPSSTATGRDSLVAGIANMVFSFRNEREHPSLAGNLGFPVRDAPPWTAERLGDVPGGTCSMKAHGSYERGLRSMPIDPKVARQDTAFSRAAEQDHGHSYGRTRPKPGFLQAGNDCDASRAGLQGDRGRR